MKVKKVYVVFRSGLRIHSIYTTEKEARHITYGQKSEENLFFLELPKICGFAKSYVYDKKHEGKRFIC